MVFLYIYGPPKPTFLEFFIVNNLVFRWPKPLFFMVLGAHGIYINYRVLKGVCSRGGGNWGTLRKIGEP